MATASKHLPVGAPLPAPTALARHRQLSPTASVRVSPLCLGTMGFGNLMKGYMGECSQETAFEILDTFVAAGGNFIDTANNYQHEEAEKWLGEWMASRDNRESMVLATKYGAAYKLHDKKKYPIQSNWGGTLAFLFPSTLAYILLQCVMKKVLIHESTVGTGIKNLKSCLEASLKKLQTHYVDILYLHFWDYTTSIPELMHALNDLVVAGKVHYLGISDTPAWVVTKVKHPQPPSTIIRPYTAKSKTIGQSICP